MSTSRKTIYIVEDDASYSKGLSRFIRASGFEVETFDSANDFLANADIRHPGCLLLDIRLPDIDGLSLHEMLKEKDCRLPVVFMTGHGDIPMGVKAMKNGAVDFLPKPFQPEELLNAIHEAIRKKSRDVREAREKERIDKLMEALTPREMEILRWLITGRLNKQIAYELGITEKTVIVHRGRVMKKTNASSLIELARLAEKAGITPAD